MNCKSRRITTIDDKIVDIEFIRRYYDNLTDYDKDLLRWCCCTSGRKHAKYFKSLFNEVEIKCGLTHEDAKRFLNLCIQWSMYPYPFYRSKTKQENNLQQRSIKIKQNAKSKSQNKVKNKNKNIKSFDKWVEMKEKEDLEIRKQKYRLNPAQYTISTTEPPSSKISESRQYKLHYDEISEFLRNVEWKQSDIVVQDVFVFHGFLLCSNRKHNLFFYKIKIQDVNDEYKVCDANVIYCNDCNKFFIDSTQFKSIIKSGYLPRVRIHSDDTTIDNFRQESELALYGYNAQKTTPQSTRQRVLYNVIKNRLMTVGQVISHLEGLIGLAEYNDKKQDVVKRYQDDIMFIHSSFDEEQLLREKWAEIRANLIIPGEK